MKASNTVETLQPKHVEEAVKEKQEEEMHKKSENKTVNHAAARALP